MIILISFYKCTYTKKNQLYLYYDFILNAISPISARDKGIRRSWRRDLGTGLPSWRKSTWRWCLRRRVCVSYPSPRPCQENEHADCRQRPVSSSEQTPFDRPRASSPESLKIPLLARLKVSIKSSRGDINWVTLLLSESIIIELKLAAASKKPLGSESVGSEDATEHRKIGQKHSWLALVRMCSVMSSVQFS